MLSFAVSSRFPAGILVRPSDKLSLPPGHSVNVFALLQLREKRDPLFSTACALFLIRDFVHLFCFVASAHSLAKTPGGGGSIGLSNQTPRFPVCVTQTECIRYAETGSKDFGMNTICKDPPGAGGLSCFLRSKSQKWLWARFPALSPVRAPTPTTSATPHSLRPST